MWKRLVVLLIVGIAVALAASILGGDDGPVTMPGTVWISDWDCEIADAPDGRPHGLKVQLITSQGMGSPPDVYWLTSDGIIADIFRTEPMQRFDVTDEVVIVANVTWRKCRHDPEAEPPF